MATSTNPVKADTGKRTFKFEQFGILHDEFSYESTPTEVISEKLKASVRWMHFAANKWVISVCKMEAQNILKKNFHNVKILLLPNTPENKKMVGLANQSAKSWTYQTFQPLDEKVPLYNCFEDVATHEKTPFILCPATPEEVTCLAVGLYDTEKTKRKRYRIKIPQLVLVDNDAERVYNMKQVKFEGTYKHNEC